jgi:hypothetical protein
MLFAEGTREGDDDLGGEQPEREVAAGREGCGRDHPVLERHRDERAHHSREQGAGEQDPAGEQRERQGFRREVHARTLAQRAAGRRAPPGPRAAPRPHPLRAAPPLGENRRI